MELRSALAPPRVRLPQARFVERFLEEFVIRQPRVRAA
jgi:hypothetical protein